MKVIQNIFVSISRKEPVLSNGCSMNNIIRKRAPNKEALDTKASNQ